MHGFVEAVANLHREKNAAYGNSWKRRGEVVSIVCNVSRKVDRLEASVHGAPEARDESLLDTAMDLFVYCVKYQTFLADIDQAIAAALFSDSNLSRPYSDGIEATEFLFRRTDLDGLVTPEVTIVDGILRIVRQFEKLLDCFHHDRPACPNDVRLDLVRTLSADAVQLIGAIRQDRPKLFNDLVRGIS
jgi:hypothetical protein